MCISTTTNKEAGGKIMAVGRNDPCPCGSGQKFKNCCLQKQNVEEMAAYKREQFYQAKQQ